MAETTGGFRGFKLWALAVSGSVVKQSVMVLVVWGSKFSFKCDRNMLGMAAVSEEELSADLCPVQGHLSCLSYK